MKPDTIAKMTDPDKLRTLMDNAERLGRDDVYMDAFRRLSELEGLELSDPMDRDFYRVLNAYEQLLTEKNGRTTKANRTRQKLRRKGVEQCLIDRATGAGTGGFDLLVEKGLPELTAENVVIKYADRFDDDVVQAAHTKLLAAGLDIE